MNIEDLDNKLLPKKGEKKAIARLSATGKFTFDCWIARAAKPVSSMIIMLLANLMAPKGLAGVLVTLALDRQFILFLCCSLVLLLRLLLWRTI